MNQHSKPRLSIRQESLAIIIISLDSPIYQPRWEEIMQRIVTLIFTGRDIYLISDLFPQWDLDIADLSLPFIKKQYGSTEFVLISAPAVSDKTLKIVVESQDFHFGEIPIIAIPHNSPERINKFISIMCQRDSLKMLETTEEYMDCSDYKQLNWNNPTSKVVLRCQQLLKQIADQQDWQFITEIA